MEKRIRDLKKGKKMTHDQIESPQIAKMALALVMCENKDEVKDKHKDEDEMDTHFGVTRARAIFAIRGDSI